MSRINLSSMNYLLYKIECFYEEIKSQIISLLNNSKRILKADAAVKDDKYNKCDKCDNNQSTTKNSNHIRKEHSHSHKNFELTTVEVDDKTIELPVPCKISKYGFYLPAKPILEALGITCFWNDNKINIDGSRNFTPGMLLAYKDKTFVTLGANTKFGTAQGHIFELSKKSYVNKSVKPGILMCPIDFIYNNFDVSFSFDSTNNVLKFFSHLNEIKLDKKEAKFRKLLEESGYDVQLGIAHNINPVELCSYGILPSYYNTDGEFSYLSISIPENMTQTSVNTYPWSFKLNPDEAIIVVGRTPSQCNYYSFRSYLSYRYSINKKSRNKIFTSLDDSLNALSIKTFNSETPYDHAFLTITSSNPTVFNTIKYLASCSGYCRKDIYNDPLAFNKLRLGLNEEADEFTLLITLEAFEDEKKRLEYVNSPPLTIMRITPNEKAVPYCFCSPGFKKDCICIYENRNISYSNKNFNYNLFKILEDLEAAIIKKHGKYSYDKLSSNFYNDGDVINTTNPPLKLSSNDTDMIYIKTDEDFTLGNNENDFVIIYGILHSKTNYSIYSDINLYSSNPLDKLLSINFDLLPNTASEYLPNHPLSKYLYVWKISKNNLDSIYKSNSPTNDINESNPLFLLFKVQLESSFSIDNVSKQVIMDSVIHFYK